MLIYYSQNASCVLKALLLERLLGMPVTVREPKMTNLFWQEEIDADTCDLDLLVDQYVQMTGKDLSWLKKQQVSRFYARINYALRHSSPAKYGIIEGAVRDALMYGLEYFLGNVSASCRRLSDIAREVSHEVQRMLGFIRFHAPDEHTLIARPKLFHNTGDLILKKFQARYPHFRIILILEDWALSLEKGQITTLSLNEAGEYLPMEDTYSKIWEKYYRSQYVESRKNIALASKAIPQKYWDWMAEGKILREEKYRK